MSFNRRAILGEVTVTFWATAVLVIILIIFVALSGFIKIIQMNKGGTILREGNSKGVGDIFLYSNEFESINEIQFLLDSNGVLGLSQEKTKIFISNYVGAGRYGPRTLFKFRDNIWQWSSDGVYWIPSGESSVIINDLKFAPYKLKNSALVASLAEKSYEEGVLIMKDNYACSINEANLYSKEVSVCPEQK